jgi:hypothetical protein
MKINLSPFYDALRFTQPHIAAVILIPEKLGQVTGVIALELRARRVGIDLTGPRQCPHLASLRPAG